MKNLLRFSNEDTKFVYLGTPGTPDAARESAGKAAESTEEIDGAKNEVHGDLDSLLALVGAPKETADILASTESTESPEASDNDPEALPTLAGLVDQPTLVAQRASAEAIVATVSDTATDNYLASLDATTNERFGPSAFSSFAA